jgi:hypothetical protein
MGIDFVGLGAGLEFGMMLDGTNSEAQAAPLGCVFVPWFLAGTNSTRDFR